MSINWTTVNVPTILSVGAAVWGIFSYVGGMKSDLTATDREIAAIKSNVAIIQSSLENLPYRVGVIEKGLEEAGKRTDRLSEVVLQNMEGIKREVNTITTEMRVLSSKFDDAFPRRKSERMEYPQVPL